MFSPSGRASIFSGTRSIEEIMARYVNLPENERGKLQNQEYLERALVKLKSEAQDRNIQNQARSSPAKGDSKLEEIQQEIVRCKSQMAVMEKRLRVFEGDPFEITTMSEAENREQLLEETLKQVRLRKQVLEKYSSGDAPSSSRGRLYDVNIKKEAVLPHEAINANNMATASTSNIFDWLPPRDPQVQIMNFMNFNGLFPPRQNEHVNRGSVMESGNNVNVQRSEFGQMIDMNLSPWTQFYPHAGNGPMLMSNPGERAFNETFLSQYSP
ncbi:agamous-like MADS-box protein AGL104 isoform X3 [Rutidosis leptorrhynchoides]